MAQTSAAFGFVCNIVFVCDPLKAPPGVVARSKSFLAQATRRLVKSRSLAQSLLGQVRS
eukprot:SAG31_NODE_47005_length_252_cov_0.666667_1_plen_58_part_01